MTNIDKYIDNMTCQECGQHTNILINYLCKECWHKSIDYTIPIGEFVENMKVARQNTIVTSEELKTKEDENAYDEIQREAQCQTKVTNEEEPKNTD